MELRAKLLDALGEAVIATDADGIISYWNRAAERLFGWTADEVLGRDIVEVTPAREARAQADEIMEGLRSGASWSGEFLAHHRDGRTFPILVTNTAVRDETGAVVGIVGVSRDTSAQRATEAALQESEARRRLAGRATNDVIWDLDVRTGRLHWNDAARSVFRYGDTEPGDTLDWWRERIHPVDRDRVEDGLKRALEGEGDVWTDEYRFLRGDGTFAAVYDRGYIARDGRGRAVRMVSSMVDVTERHRAEEAQRFLAQASMLLELSRDHEISLANVARLAAATMADYCLIFLLHDDGRLRLATAAHADPRQEPHLDALRRHLGDRTARDDSVLARVLRTGRSVLVTEPSDALFGGIAGDSALQQAIRALAPRSHILAPLSARDRVLGAIALATAESGMRYGTRELQLAEELGRRCGLAVDNARLYETAVLASQAKGDFLAIVSHELRTPLTAVLGASDLLASGAPGALNEQQRQHLDRIRASGLRLLELIDGILSFARLESGTEALHAGSTSLGALVDGATTFVVPMAEEKGIEFDASVPDPDLEIHTDPSKVRQILLSLLSNAVKFTDHGRVELTTEVAGDHVVFRVTDTGMGIPQDRVQQVFSPFWQAEHVDTRRSGGAGLGLAVARRLARMLGGDVRIEHTSPTGTTITFHTPITVSPP